MCLEEPNLEPDTRFPFMCRIGTKTLLIHSLELELDGSSCDVKNQPTLV